MKIKWLGHSSFLMTSGSGKKILTDPYESVFGLKYGEIKESADVVTVSHEHGDHNNTKAVKGNPVVVKTSGPVEHAGIKIRGIDTFHDGSRGKERGTNVVFCFEIDGLNVCHLGDLGHTLTAEQVKSIGKIDILMVPVGGNFTIDAAAAGKIIATLKPAVVIPMHFRNNRCPEFPVAGLDEFTKGKTNITVKNSSEIEYKIGKLPASTQIVVLEPAG